ncbi:MAG: hypothetical protein Tsb0014_15360 [Pleurocapsa sp.]
MYSDSLSSSALQQHLKQQLQQIFANQLSDIEIQRCLKNIAIGEPNPGKQFWTSYQSTPGIFLILQGRVRLLNTDNYLLTSLEAGTSFGESTLFPDQEFIPYVARASFKLKVAFIPGNVLQNLLQNNPNLAEHLNKQALERELLLLCRQAPELRSLPPDKLQSLIPLLQPQYLAAGEIVSSGLSTQYLWLIRKGELESNTGKKITGGSIYFPTPANSEITWRVNESTELYSLSNEDSYAVQVYSSQLPVIANSAIAETTNAPIPLKKVTQFDSPLPGAKSPSQQTSKKPRRTYFPSPKQRAGHFWQRLTHRYPFYGQHSASDCGAACLIMIGKYWGQKFSLNHVRDLANVNRSGSTLRGLSAAAEAIGFISRPVQATFDRLSQQKLPAIVHWENNHYIVLYEITSKNVIVGDPAVGQRTLSHREFKASWSGYALLLEPTNWLQEGQKSAFPIWRFLELLKPHRLVLTEIFFASILLQVFGLVTPLLTQLLLDRVVVQRSSITLMTVGMGLMIFGLFSIAIGGLRQYLLDHTSQKVNVAMIVGFIRHNFKLPLSFFESRYVGDIMARLQENEKIQRFLTGESLSIFLDFLTIFVYAGLMFWYSWKLALLALAIVPPFFLLALVATPFLQKISREIFAASAEENSYLIEALTGISTVKSMAIEHRVRWHWEKLLNKSIRKEFGGQIISNRLQIISSTIDLTASTSILWFGAWQVINDELTIGQLIAFNMLLGNVISPFKRLSVLWNDIQEIIISVERINDVLEAEPEEDIQKQLRQSLPAIQGHIRFENVTFRYHPDDQNNVLENLSFEVQPGQTVALVGRSGSGKTTISKLILGLYAPTEGTVAIDGYDLSQVSLTSLRQQIGVVDQANFLFGGTIRDNIGIRHPEATLEEIREAAEQAGADEFIQKLPLKYDTLIGERGGLLSGGQCQRLAIARALLGNPRLLILDEATSNLDAESERIIQSNLNQITQDRTTIIIAHRLSTIRNADLILVLDRGILVERGTHQELMTRQGHYYYLNQQQLAVSH